MALMSSRTCPSASIMLRVLMVFPFHFMSFFGRQSARDTNILSDLNPWAVPITDRRATLIRWLGW